jgi:hypothetical protein
VERRTSAPVARPPEEGKTTAPNVRKRERGNGFTVKNREVQQENPTRRRIKSDDLLSKREMPSMWIELIDVLMTAVLLVIAIKEIVGELVGGYSVSGGTGGAIGGLLSHNKPAAKRKCPSTERK